MNKQEGRELTVRELFNESMYTVCLLINTQEATPEQVLHTGMFFGTVSKWLAELERLEREQHTNSRRGAFAGDRLR